MVRKIDLTNYGMKHFKEIADVLREGITPYCPLWSISITKSCYESLLIKCSSDAMTKYNHNCLICNLLFPKVKLDNDIPSCCPCSVYTQHYLLKRVMEIYNYNKKRKELK